MKILFLVPYPLKQSPSQRFRFEQYFDILKANGHHTEVQSFLNARNWKIFYEPGGFGKKTAAMLMGFFKRMVILMRAPSFDFIFIHREVTPIGPPVAEWILAKVLKKKIIYDFDDAIWLTDRRNESWIVRSLKWRSKVSAICGWSYRVSCGNDYLVSFARQYNVNVVYNPTTIDTTGMHNPALHRSFRSDAGKITIGWTGSHSTLKYLHDAVIVLKRIEERFPEVQVMVIADHNPELELKQFLFLPWRAETEIRDLMNFDIGIMPLPDDEWANGKCGFKVLQYMALNIPAIASSVGVNSKIINDGETGFLCTSIDTWERAIIRLIQDPLLRAQVGKLGRGVVIDHYSVLSNSTTFLTLFEK